MEIKEQRLSMIINEIIAKGQVDIKSMAKKLNYELFIDNKSGYSLKKNTLRKHLKYMLDLFNINQNYAPNELIYDKFHKKIKKKF